MDAVERKVLVDDLQALPDVAPANMTKMQVEGREYVAAAVSDDWVAIYRDLKPGEAPPDDGERAIAVVDLLSTADDAS
ncbi:hypothetical protein FZI85_26670 [Mycobacterium sp. CBMA293]|uniref:hypothetical protein n=1 Tax=unclassified Mycolicibacterium TaxID=2636767 RepID=UPI0012DE4F46|nr:MULTISPECIES: hypothetical protein [unclassified Mycolicibacterium]MUL48593.1 hypothetical protein [Mycolicibacterium sp. CBMA 360]MUL62050.1 hypothetical protein [Mycolicibacterium sp. CBMA 335]MUL73325.1 hypothetical protein [Mycolicibacterium sp. CBMA 311]MUL96494.1 hypothetical protein [Mycolicibacterium sp. CBMA 230]MUM05392.1 hypothetical protein [Mycolicibacterium sp. CBMA 213]